VKNIEKMETSVRDIYGWPTSFVVLAQIIVLKNPLKTFFLISSIQMYNVLIKK
jgi:hypothetical protein